MTQWGALLLCGYIALGATSRLTRRAAGRVALVLTVAVVTVAMLAYMRHTPADKYYKNTDATVYATGVRYPSPSTGLNASSTEDVSGVQPATPGNTVTTPNTGVGGG